MTISNINISYFYKHFHDRHSLLIGERNIEKIKRATVMVCGVGGLGSAAAYFLARYGVGSLILLDPDVIELSNLNRQYFFYEDVGIPKVYAVKKLLTNINPFIDVKTFHIKLQEMDPQKLRKLINTATVIIDGMDDRVAKVILNRMAKILKKPVVHAHGCGFKSTITTFLPGGPYYEELFGIPSKDLPLDKVTDDVLESYRYIATKLICGEHISGDLLESIARGEKPMQVSVPPATINGLFTATEAIKIIIGRFDLVIKAPKMLVIDPWLHKYEIIDVKPIRNDEYNNDT